MATSIASTSNQVVWLPIRSEHPITGAVDLSTFSAEAAFVTTGLPGVSDWVAATWESGTKLIGGKPFYLAAVELGPNGSKQLAAGTYRTFLRITTLTDVPIIEVGALIVY